MPLNSSFDLAKVLETGNNELPFKSALGPRLPADYDLRDRLDSFFDHRGGLAGVPDRLRLDIERIFGTLYDDRQPTLPFGIGAAESVVVADGSRPVFFVEGDKLTLKGKPNGPFVDIVAGNASAFEEAARSVGRIETFDLPAPPGVDVYYEGTGFLVGRDLIMTNRHVVENMVHESHATKPSMTFKNAYYINFDGQLGGAGNSRRVEITGVEYVGPAFIGQSDDFARLDMALLRLGAPLDAAFVQPQGLALTATPLAREDKVTVIGFPGSALIYDRTGVPPPGHELEQVLIDVFDRRFGYKRCAPGRVSGLPGTDPRDTKQWAVVHDASTLGGNSGSPVLTLKDGKAQVSALHFYGEQRKANFAHVMERLADVLAGWSIALH